MFGSDIGGGDGFDPLIDAADVLINTDVFEDTDDGIV